MIGFLAVGPVLSHFFDQVCGSRGQRLQHMLSIFKEYHLLLRTYTFQFLVLYLFEVLVIYTIYMKVHSSLFVKIHENIWNFAFYVDRTFYFETRCITP